MITQYDRDLLQWEPGNQAIVYPDNACPACKENRMDNLIWSWFATEDEEYVQCLSCGSAYFIS